MIRPAPAEAAPFIRAKSESARLTFGKPARLQLSLCYNLILYTSRLPVSSLHFWRYRLGVRTEDSQSVKGKPFYIFFNGLPLVALGEIRRYLDSLVKD